MEEVDELVRWEGFQEGRDGRHADRDDCGQGGPEGPMESLVLVQDYIATMM